jgi:hypothetical protein
MWNLEPFEDEGEMFLPHAGNHLLSNATSHLRRLSKPTVLQILHILWHICRTQSFVLSTYYFNILYLSKHLPP